MFADDLHVRDVMSRTLVTVPPDESLLSAWELLSRGEFHHLPVVDRARCVSLVDDRQVAAALANPLVRRHRRVSEMMPRRVHRVLEDTSLRRVAEIMLLEHVTGLPVVDERMGLVGLVTDRDVLAAVAGSGADQVAAEGATL
jgi:CBS domain-containing membrane protein